MTVVVGKTIEYHDTTLRAPQHQILIVILWVLQIMADKTLAALV
jgi:hypothetical protein